MCNEIKAEKCLGIPYKLLHNWVHHHHHHHHHHYLRFVLWNTLWYPLRIFTRHSCPLLLNKYQRGNRLCLWYIKKNVWKIGKELQGFFKCCNRMMGKWLFVFKERRFMKQRLTFTPVSSLKGFIDSVRWLDNTIINRIQTLIDIRMILVGLLPFYFIQLV